MNVCNFTTRGSKRWSYKKSPQHTAKTFNFTTKNRKSYKNSSRMFYRKWNEFDLYSKQKYQTLVRAGAVEEEVDDLQQLRGSNPCKSGEITYFSDELWWILVRSLLTLAVNLHNFTAFTAFHRKLMYEICGEKTNFSPLILHIFPIFLDPGSTFWSSIAFS